MCKVITTCFEDYDKIKYEDILAAEEMLKDLYGDIKL
jgi:hypothetical protein